MKANPDLPDVRELLMGLIHEDALPEPTGGTPISLAERVDAREALVKAIQSGNVQMQCVGCGEAVAVSDAAACVCGGFVCSACRAVEEDGVCNHEIDDHLLPDDDDGS